jgi:hypothetical protein
MAMMSGNNGFNAKNFGMASGAGGIGAGLYGLFNNNNNPADAAMPYLDQAQNSISPYYQPYINAGNEATSRLQDQYGDILNNPGGKLNEIGAGYQQSPGFKFALQQALQGAGHAAAAGGMAGSPMHEQQNMQLATDIGNQDYYHWLGGATGLYGEGLHGEQAMSGQGFTASNNVAEQIAQILAQKGNLAYAGQQGQNQAENSAFGNIFGGAATLAAFL